MIPGLRLSDEDVYTANDDGGFSPIVDIDAGVDRVIRFDMSLGALAAAFNISEPRNAHGEWTSTGYAQAQKQSEELFKNQKLRPREELALKEYRNSSSVNAVLRGFNDDSNPYMGEVKEDIKQIDNVMKRQPLSKDIVVYRAYQGHGTLENLKPGDVFTDKAYISTTIQADAAHRFYDNFKMFGRDGGIAKIIVPKGTHAAWVSPKGWPHEDAKVNEILLDRDLKFKVIGKRGDHFDLKVVA